MPGSKLNDKNNCQTLRKGTLIYLHVRTHLIVDGPADVLKVRVIEELVGIFLHPLADFAHADRSDFGQDISISVDEHGLEHVGQHVLDFVGVLLQLLAPGFKLCLVK